jgi:hypothetical protein
MGRGKYTHSLDSINCPARRRGQTWAEGGGIVTCCQSCFTKEHLTIYCSYCGEVSEGSFPHNCWAVKDGKIVASDAALRMFFLGK